MSLFDSASICITPNGVKEGKLYSIKPTDGSGDLSVTRATTATRVNSAGLVELVPYNLATYSNTFTNGVWTNLNQTLTANSVANPINGNVDAYTISLNSGTSAKVVLQSINQVGTYTQSVYVKANTHNFIQLLVGSDTSPYANFNISAGTSNAYNCTASITSVGNGWYRCAITYTTSTGSAFYIWSVDSLTSARASNSASTGSYYAYGFQLVEGSSAKDYFPTTNRLNIPRLDYTNGTCPSILVEPQRTNLALYSEQFDNAAWTKNAATISANSIVAPNGTLTADKLVEDTTNDAHYLDIRPTVNNSINTSSIYVKAAGRTKFQLREGSNGDLVTFDLSNPSGNIISVGNGWFRVWLSTTPDATTYIFQLRLLNDSGNLVYTGNGTSGLYVWGAQLEAGSYATSYIPTVASSVTRNADVISKTGISSLIGQTEGTVFIEHIYNTEITNPIGADDIVIGFSNGTLNNLLLIIHYGSGVNSYNNKLRLYIRNAGADQALIDLAGTTTGTYKIAVAYKNNDVAFYVNGVQVGIDTSVSVPTLSNLYLYDFLGTNTKYNTDKVKSAAIWKTRLDNATLAQLTTI
jgi:hypothetical protein